MGHAQHRSQEVDEPPGVFRNIYNAHYANVLAYCGRRVGRDDAPDVAAEVFAVAWQRVDVIPHGGEALPWLYAVAYRVVCRHWRGQKRRSRLRVRLSSVSSPPVDPPDTPLIQREEYDLVLQAASQLRSLDREALQLAIWEELSHSEIADILGSSETAVRQRLYRARRGLRREFERIGGTVPTPTVAQEGGANEQ